MGAMKQCFKCGLFKPLNDFYKHPQMTDGHLGKCKECGKRDVRENLEKKKNDPQWLKKERARSRAKAALRRFLGKQQHPSKAVAKKWRLKNNHKRKAQSLAAKALKLGLLTKPKQCQNCGRVGYVEKHHPDYTKPLLVEWLCKPCHGKTRWKDKNE